MSNIKKLKCRKCGNNLTGKNNSKIFFCLSCRLGYDISGEKAGMYNLAFGEPVRKENFLMEYFPFWKLNCEINVENRSEDIKKRSEVIFYIPSFYIKNINYFGDLGYYYMKKNVVIDTGEKKDLQVFPADRGLNDVISYPKIYLLKDLSKEINKLDLDINVRILEKSLILIPFYFKDHLYYDSILFWKYPSGALI
ncbi:MAG: hypothetical protein ABFR75_07725 [Acidobacteriota bacterium]